ncbi:MAG: hypothetical protein KC535_02230 [Nanoarchaeota archaeon]|nr:hypothetical protein [Nanoarchaeota archaeon]
MIVFDNYASTYTLSGGKLLVEKQLRLKNVGNSPIIPGEIHFKISQEGSKDTVPEVSQYVARNGDGNELDTQLIKTANDASLVFTVWDPLLPGFFYDVTMSYEIDFRPKGVLFYSVNLPEERTTIPIKKFESTVILPKRDHFTYAPDAEVSSTEKGREATWSEQSAIDFEYSIIPLPKLGFKAVNLFWIVIMVVLVVQLFVKMRKLRRL